LLLFVVGGGWGGVGGGVGVFGGGGGYEWMGVECLCEIQTASIGVLLWAGAMWAGAMLADAVWAGAMWAGVGLARTVYTHRI